MVQLNVGQLRARAPSELTLPVNSKEIRTHQNLSFNPMLPVFNLTEIPSKRSKEQNVTGIMKEIPLGLDCPVWSSVFFATSGINQA